MLDLGLYCSRSVTSLLSVLSLFSSDFSFFSYVNDNECVHVVCAYLFSCLSSVTVGADSYNSAALLSTLSAALHTRPECCWEA